MLILITGASGSGTSTLGAALAKELGIAHLDADDYYWLPTAPPFTTKRDRAERLSLALRDVRAKGSVVLAGSIMEWGLELENAFDLIVFLYLDAAIRVERLRAREIEFWGRPMKSFSNGRRNMTTAFKAEEAWRNIRLGSRQELVRCLSYEAILRSRARGGRDQTSGQRFHRAGWRTPRPKDPFRSTS